MEKLKEVWDYELLEQGEDPLTVNWKLVFSRSPDFGPAGRDGSGIILRLSGHNHNFSDSWNIYRQLHIFGVGGGAGNDETILTFPNGKCGSKAATPTTTYVPPVFKPFGKIEL